MLLGMTLATNLCLWVYYQFLLYFKTLNSASWRDLLWIISFLGSIFLWWVNRPHSLPNFFVYFYLFFLIINLYNLLNMQLYMWLLDKKINYKWEKFKEENVYVCGMDGIIIHRSFFRLFFGGKSQFVHVFIQLIKRRKIFRI